MDHCSARIKRPLPPLACAARLYGNEVKRTRRYALAEHLSTLADRMLLLTATPHAGDVEQFNLFLQLLDADQFANSELNQQMIQIEHGPWFLRRMKEELRDLNGRPLFTERHPLTVRFELSRAEMRLYKAVTEYINDFLPHQKGRRKVTVALARMVLRRRLASSLYAIGRSLRKRRDRFTAVLDELEGLRPAEQARRLQQLRLLDVDDEQDEDDHEERELDELIEGTLAIERVDQLRTEVAALRRLVDLADQTLALGEETKLRTLQQLLEGTDFDELRDGRGKLLIFTEHKDTLDYLRGNLEQWGYTTCEIHGGLNAIRRKEAQDDFRRDRQICIATEAAGEGINLQFCHLMINYDIPWNPNRLGQRMGRIHRIGQERDVYIFNFVAEQSVDGEPIVEGKILARLLLKLEEMHEALGNRVFDVIGQLLRLNEVDLEDMLREATYNPKRLEEYEYKVEPIRAAISQGVRDGVLGYSAALQHDASEQPFVTDHRLAKIDVSLAPQEIDLSASSYLLAPDLARRLAQPPEQVKSEQVTYSNPPASERVIILCVE